MNKYLAVLFTLFFFSCSGNAAELTNAGPGQRRAQSTDLPSPTEWRQMYFVAITRKKPSEIDLSQELMTKLVSEIEVRSAIYTGAALEPQYLINAKGVTAWIAMWVFITHGNPDLVKSLGTGPGAAWVRPAFMNSAFGAHINWPEKMLRSHNLDVTGHKLVAIPFLVPKNGPALRKLPRSVKTPDGSLEVFGFHEFDEKNPESLLKEFEAIAHSIRKERVDLSGVKP